MLKEQLAQPSASYKHSARLAVAGLIGFVLLYFALAGWFLYTAYRLLFQSDAAGKNVGWAYAMAACALLFAVFMLKAIFAVRNAKLDGLLEVTADEQPRLFAFLFALADAAGAPRPHKVFLSERVNAAVFYDLSLFNLIFPSKKNLEVGLALVNMLNLGELRAVLAHEFGHFAQRSMAVGRWVYVAQQITAHMVSRRDKLEDFLVKLGNVDIRVRAGVWVLQLIIWSIRSLVESAFHLVVVVQRALSREMEMQADLVAVSLTGSDALIHALHRLQSADDAWERALRFASGEKAGGRRVRDVFAIQACVAQRMAEILDDGAYAPLPPLPQQEPQQHRVFQAEMARPPKMWQTHPLNHEREANAKRIYVAAPIDGASAWSLFDAPQQLRERVSTQLLGESEQEPVALELSLRELAKQFRREQYRARYCGVYFGRTLTRHAMAVEQLRDAAHDTSVAALAQLYPVSLKDIVRRQRALEQESAQLQALMSGALTAPDGVVRLRGDEFKLSQLPAVRQRVRAELDETHAQLRAHDRACRNWHYGAAKQLGNGWSDYLDGLLAVLHYTEHSEADLRDALGLLQNTVHMATAAGRTTADSLARILIDANVLHSLMARIYEQRESVLLDTKLCKRLALNGGWPDMLGQFDLPGAARENVNDWMRVIDGWVRQFTGPLSVLRTAALEQLLITERLLAGLVRRHGTPQAAPAPSRVPPAYALLLHGDERELQTRLGWWARFKRADGWLPGGARLVVAGGIVAVVLGLGSAGGNTALTIYNGLGTTVQVKIDGQVITLAPFVSAVRDVAAQRHHHIETSTASGQQIEQFDSDQQGGFADAVYNVAGAAPMVEWTAIYGGAAAVPERRLGAPRWLVSHADILFGKAPDSISTNGGGGTRSVLEGVGALAPGQQLSLLAQPEDGVRIAQLHARWDDTQLPATEDWIELAAKMAGNQAILAERLKAAPDDVVLLRAEQELASPRTAAFCQRFRARAAQQPDNGDLAYIALRCLSDDAQSDQGMLEAHQRWPANPWLAYAAAYIKTTGDDPLTAIPDLRLVRSKLPPLAEAASLTLARLERLSGNAQDLDDLATSSPRLRNLLMLDQGSGIGNKPQQAYIQLQRGELAAAVNSSSGDAWQEAQILRLVAGSDGAGANSVHRALDLPVQQGLDQATVWISLALAMKNGADTAPYLEASRKIYGPYQPKMQAFLEQVQRSHGADLNSAGQLLAHMPIELRAYAYSAAIVLAGREAPQAWRDVSRRLLFASERPHFG